MSLSFFTKPSPCLKCEKKDYAAGCSNGCTERDKWVAERDLSRQQAAMTYEAHEMLRNGAARRIKKARVEDK